MSFATKNSPDMALCASHARLQWLRRHHPSLEPFRLNRRCTYSKFPNSLIIFHCRCHLANNAYRTRHTLNTDPVNSSTRDILLAHALPAHDLNIWALTFRPRGHLLSEMRAPQDAASMFAPRNDKPDLGDDAEGEQDWDDVLAVPGFGSSASVTGHGPGGVGVLPSHPR